MLYVYHNACILENKIDDLEIVKQLKDAEIDILCNKVMGDKIRLRRQIEILNREVKDYKDFMQTRVFFNLYR